MFQNHDQWSGSIQRIFVSSRNTLTKCSKRNEYILVFYYTRLVSFWFLKRIIIKDQYSTINNWTK